MAYHLKTPGKLGIDTVYWKGNNTWTETYADRKSLTLAEANALKATTVTSPQGITYQPKWFANSTVVNEG
tara:strand:+ start:84 stop:293 length:210 start_codon:yes stop_codon:yes gene_type:complete